VVEKQSLVVMPAGIDKQDKGSIINLYTSQSIVKELRDAFILFLKQEFFKNEKRRKDMKDELKKFTGINVALHACYDEAGEVNPKAYKTVCSHYASLGIKGLYVCGSNGEGLLMNVDERKKVLESIVEAVAGKMVIIAHIGALSTRDSVELAKHAESLKVDAISSLPCIYYPATDKAVEAHWKKIIDSTALPFIIYNIPGTTHYVLTPELCKKMAAYSNVIGIKNSSMVSYDINRFKRIGGEDFIVFNGPDEQYLAGRMSGAIGGIGGSYGVIPELLLKIEDYIQSEEFGKAQKVQNAINYVIEKMYDTGSFVGAAKEIISRRITYIGEPRMPIRQLDKTGKKAAGELIPYIEKINREL
jgi:N-acetylneuraminate lyase